MFLGAKLQCRRNPRAEDPRLLNQLLRHAYRDVPVRGLLIRAGYTAIPGWLFPALRSLYRGLGSPLSRKL
jgi:hypothetical protein